MASKTAVEICKLFYKSPDLSPAAAVALLAERNITVTESLAAAWKRDLGSMIEGLTEIGAFSSPAPVIAKKAKKARPPTRSSRWADACAQAQAGLYELKSLQEEYSEWKDSLPENLAASPVGEKLDAVCDLDLDSAVDMVGEAEGLDLPQGFGRD